MVEACRPEDSPHDGSMGRLPQFRVSGYLKNKSPGEDRSSRIDAFAVKHLKSGTGRKTIPASVDHPAPKACGRTTNSETKKATSPAGGDAAGQKERHGARGWTCRKTVSEGVPAELCENTPRIHDPPGSGLNSFSSLPSTLFHCSASAGTSPLRVMLGQSPEYCRLNWTHFSMSVSVSG